VVGPSDGASPLAEGSRWPEGHGCGPDTIALNCLVFEKIAFF